MRVLQVPFHFYPDVVGGTEVYVASLAKLLTDRGLEIEIAAPGEQETSYMHQGLRVHRFAVRKKIGDLSELYGLGDSESTRQFSRILDATLPDIVHLHALSPAVSLQLTREVKRRGIPVIFTYHIPGITCQRGTLLQNGTRQCDGVWAVKKCSRCVLQSRGVVTPLNQMLGTLPPAAGRTAGKLGRPGRVVTALRMTELLTYRQNALREFLNEVDRIVAVSVWIKELLVRNGIPETKIRVSRHGATQVNSQPRGENMRTKCSGPLRVAFMGRLYPTKGVHVLLEALRRHANLRVQLDIYGIIQEQKGQHYADSLRKIAPGDDRIRFFPPIANDAVVACLRAYDLLAVPSQWLETGPLVVYDAFSAGVPVLGSRRGGISEIVRHGYDGLLVEASDVEEWARALEKLADDRELLEQLRAGVRPPRTMVCVAEEMLDLYEHAVHQSSAVLAAIMVNSGTKATTSEAAGI